MPRKPGQFSKEWILSLQKIITNNGCWISHYAPATNGYVSVTINRKKYQLHRIAMCLWNNIDYSNQNIDSRHSTGCDKRCFNPEHIKPGSKSENAIDSVNDKTHKESRKSNCQVCGAEYASYTYRIGPHKGKTYRYCYQCKKRKLHIRRQA
jgi:hypothetical protein